MLTELRLYHGNLEGSEGCSTEVKGMLGPVLQGSIKQAWCPTASPVLDFSLILI